MKQEFLNNHYPGEEIILTKHNGQNFTIIIKKIFFCEAEGNYTNVYCNGDQRLIVICRRLSFFKRKLRNYNEFQQYHRTYIINLDEVTCFCSETNKLLISGYEVPVAKKKWNKIVPILQGNGLKNREYNG